MLEKWKASATNRRNFIGAGSAAMMALMLRKAGAQDFSTITKAHSDQSASNLGAENAALQSVNSDGFMPPLTDHGETQNFWNSFSAQHRRIQEGGWSRQVTVQDFPISKDIAGVNMRLDAGGIRELHWHNAGEWSIMLNGTARITAIDNDGKAFVDDVGKNDLWFFPTGTPHSIQGTGADGCEFVLVFDDGKFSEADTTLISDWLRHVPPEVLAKNWGVSEKDLKPVYSTPVGGRYIFHAPVPGDLQKDIESASGSRGKSPVSFSFKMHSMDPTIKTKSGEVRIVDSKIFPVSTTVAAAHIVVHPGGLRELHWHQNADEWQYYLQGKGRMTVFFNGSKARTADFNAGDVGYVPRTLGHYVENTGDTDLIFLEMFKTDRFQDLSLSEWVTHLPPELLKAHIGVSKEDILANVSETKQAIVPA